jgi:hypothetical protein
MPSAGAPFAKAARTGVGHSNAGESSKDELHYVYASGTYNKDNWVASWNALAVVVSPSTRLALL